MSQVTRLPKVTKNARALIPDDLPKTEDDLKDLLLDEEVSDEDSQATEEDVEGTAAMDAEIEPAKLLKKLPASGKPLPDIPKGKLEKVKQQLREPEESEDGDYEPPEEAEESEEEEVESSVGQIKVGNKPTKGTCPTEAGFVNVSCKELLEWLGPFQLFVPLITLPGLVKDLYPGFKKKGTEQTITVSKFEHFRRCSETRPDDYEEVQEGGSEGGPILKPLFFDRYGKMSDEKVAIRSKKKNVVEYYYNGKLFTEVDFRSVIGQIYELVLLGDAKSRKKFEDLQKKLTTKNLRIVGTDAVDGDVPSTSSEAIKVYQDPEVPFTLEYYLAYLLLGFRPWNAEWLTAAST